MHLSVISGDIVFHVVDGYHLLTGHIASPCRLGDGEAGIVFTLLRLEGIWLRENGRSACLTVDECECGVSGKGVLPIFGNDESQAQRVALAEGLFADGIAGVVLSYYI